MWPDGEGILIERTLFSFIWKYSKREQLALLSITTALFPLLYLTLELPKRIINDAIGAGDTRISFYGFEMGQIPFLALLCGAFLVSVLVHGLLKMRINTMKGVLAERMLRRFRYTLISRILRFPQPYFLRTSQGELVSMVTSEAEPLGGMMGDAITQPVLQVGQMLTILSFLFLQSLWFGLAAVALIPLRAWLIPKLQRQINLLNKSRIKEVRKLASEIGESAAGASTLRMNGGWRYRLALVTDRLGRLFDIRFEIYQKKFFMKFINNFITQLTPFFFFSIGGYLVIQGEVTLGALVAALAAYKDLSSPWKELLAYYNQTQDMALRWEVITERFAPAGMIDESLFEGKPDQIPHLSGEIVLQDVTVRDANGVTVLEDLNVTFPQGGTIAIVGEGEEDRGAMAELLTREISPSQGAVHIAGHDLATLHQSVIAARIGHANSRPYMFDGSVGDNMMMPLKTGPRAASIEGNANATAADRTAEAQRAGNSPDVLDANWLDPSLAGLDDIEDVHDWWLTMVEAIGSGDALYKRGLDRKFEEKHHPELAKRLVEIRPRVAERIADAGLESLFHRFDWERYNPAVPVACNLLFSTPRRVITQQELADQGEFLLLLRRLKLDKEMLNLSQDVVDMLHQTFGLDGAGHPLFRKLGIDPDVYEKTVEIAHKSRTAHGPLRNKELALLLTVPFRVSAQQIGPAFSDQIKDRILGLRQSEADLLRGSLSNLFEPLHLTRVAAGLTVLENAIFGKLSDTAGAKVEALTDLVASTLLEAGLKRLVAELIYDEPTGLGGAKLPARFAERLAFTRAAIKRPDILVLDRALASYDPETRISASIELREEMPKATLIYLEERFERPENFDVYIELLHGRIKSSETGDAKPPDNIASTDLAEKLAAMAKADLFAGLNRRQLRLLAFSARWFTAKKDEEIFRKGDDPTDGAYLILEGEVGLYLPLKGAEDRLVTTIGKNNVVGEIALILKEPRTLNMNAQTDLKALRIGAEEFLAVVENDAETAFKFLQVLSSYLARPTK